MSNPAPSKTQVFKIVPSVPGLSNGQVMAINNDSHVNGSVSFTNSSWMLPNEAQVNGMRTLQDLISTLTSKYVTTNYYVGWSGDMYPTRCGCTTYLQAQPTGTSSIGQWQTVFSLVDGRYTTGPPNPSVLYVPLSMPSPTDVLMNLNQRTTFNDGNCHTCPNSQLYTGTFLYAYVDVTVNMYDYCTISGSNNIYIDNCYNFIGDYCQANSGCDSYITSYLIGYCSNKYPDAQLDIFNTNFNSKDYNICGCNMPTSEYDAYEKSLTDSTTPPLQLTNPDQCYFPACKSSTFMPYNLLGCPGAQCVNAVLLNNNVLAGPVTVNQNDPNCQQYTSTVNSPPGSPNTPPITVNQSGSPIKSPSQSPTSTTSNSFWSKYWGYIVGIIVALLIVLLLIVVMFIIIRKKKKSSSKSSKSKKN